jgi:4-hydroxy-tetrahydrodipicolinate reductase
VSSPLRVVVTGAGGRMGSTLCRLLRTEPGMALCGVTERGAHDLQSAGAPGVPALEDLGRLLAESKADAVIDFTSPEATVAHARVCAEHGVALVVGSTGLSSEAQAEVLRHSRKIPMVVAPNMSVGVNLVIRMAAELARLLGDGFDIEVLEAHHRNKKDAPSGTALRLAEDIARAVGRGPLDFRTAREGQVGERPQREIGIQTLRGGDVVGEHTVLFLGDGERVELTHRATSRDQFGRGALRAARWVVGRVPGHYDMNDVLGLR